VYHANVRIVLRDVPHARAVFKKSFATLLHVEIHVPIFSPATNRACARGYCVVAAQRELQMSTTAVATKKNVAPAVDAASPVATLLHERISMIPRDP
jgi:hypothetical protein